MAKEVKPRDAGVKPRVRLWNRVPFQLGMGVLLITWAALALAFLMFDRRQQQLITDQYVNTATKESVIIANDVAERMLAGGGAEVWSAISADALEHRDIISAANIRVFNGGGIVKAASDSAAIGTSIGVKDNPECPSCDSTAGGDFPAVATLITSDGARRLRVVNAVPFTAACVTCHRQKKTARALISIDYDLWPVERESAERRKDMLAMGLVAGFLVMAVTAVLFGLLVMRSVHRIAQSANRLATGDLAARADVVGKNELTMLSHDFNNMAERIEQQVTRIDAAHTESELLYALVVEASKNLETGDVTSGIVRMLLQKLHPRRAAMFLETADGGWICAIGGAGEAERMTSGAGALDEFLVTREMQLTAQLGDPPAQIVADACRTRKLQVTQAAGGLNFALPVVADTHLVGLLVCNGVPLSMQVGDYLLDNLGVHLTLTAINSRNYTGAITDGLTRLKNKRYGLIRLEEAVHLAKRHKSGLGLVMCDIDHFKQVNDTYGHPAGDAVLKEVARRIAASVRKTDIVLRYGGEEFMLILPETDAQYLPVVGEKIRQAVAGMPVDLEAANVSLPLTISVGVAGLRLEDDDGKTLIARADTALYRAKEGGRNRVESDQ